MQKESPADIFRKHFNGQPNIMTPEIVRYGWVKPYRVAYELSTGSGIFQQHIYGVTILTINPTMRDDRSKCCMSLSEAEAYIQALKQEGDNA